MATKDLSSFTVECHLNGWQCKDRVLNQIRTGGDAKFLRKGQKFSGDEIVNRMVNALEPPEDTFKDMATGKQTKVLTVIGGSVKELRASFDARREELLSEVEAVTPEPTPEPEEEKKSSKEKEPKRTPRPPQ